MRKFKAMKKEMRSLKDLKEWVDNPRFAAEEDLARLDGQIDRMGGLFKPLLITEDGTVVGGNQRLKVLRAKGVQRVWVKVLTPKDETQMAQYGISDNGRAGRYDPTRLVDVVKEAGWDEKMQAMFKAEVFEPVRIADLIKQTTDNIIGKGKEEVPDEDTNDEAKETYENGNQRQIVLFMTPEEHKRALAQFENLRVQWDTDLYIDILLAMLHQYEGNHADKKKD